MWFCSLILFKQEAIGCLASITECSKLKNFFTSMEKFVTDRVAESENLETDVPTSIYSEQGGMANKEERVEAQRY